jgi:hypothetical protein
MNLKGEKAMKTHEKVLLALLPFWSPLIPPLGIACIKTYLTKKGWDVKTVDASVEENFKQLYQLYFDVLRENVPGNKRGNFYSIGHDVLRNQMMARINRNDEGEYTGLVKTLIRKTFYIDIPGSEVLRLNNIIEEVYTELDSYFLDLLAKEKPTVLGLTVYSDTLPASMFVCKRVKEKYPHIKTIIGGGVFADQLALGSINLDVFLEKTGDYIDKIVIGEGEILLEKILREGFSGSQRLYTRRDIDNEILRLGSVDIPDLSDFHLEHYPYNVSYTSRSCPFQCSFCSETIQWGKYRKKRAGQIVEEVEKLYRKYGYQLFLFSDSLLNPVMKELAEEFLESPTAIYWGGWLRVDKNSCEEENTVKWRRSGFYHARMGIESGSQHVLDLMNKKITVDEAGRTIVSLSNAGIKTTTLWVVGYPGETESDFQETLDFIEELKDEIYEAECRPFYYYLSGQAGSDGGLWNRMKPAAVYPGAAEEMLLFQTYDLDCQPSREEIYRRANRFAAHCRKLGIPNPYSLYDIYNADQRWKKLRENAVPGLIEFKNKNGPINECKFVKRLLTVPPPIRSVDEFEF